MTVSIYFLQRSKLIDDEAEWKDDDNLEDSDRELDADGDISMINDNDSDDNGVKVGMELVDPFTPPENEQLGVTIYI
jgi:hypothetical protein